MTHSTMNIPTWFGLFLTLYLAALTNATRRPKITAPLRLKPGETPIQEPGWKHCLTDMKASGAWKQLRSPGYPKLPGNQMQCSWIIEAPIGWRVAAAFKDLDMAYPAGDGIYKSCRSAYVNVVDVLAQKSQGKFCGKKAPGDYVSLGSKLRLDLQTDKSTTAYRGFVITYRAVRVKPGFRAARRFSSPSDSAPGKININEFKSTQQRLMNSGGRPKGSQRYGPGPKRPMYASDIRTLPQETLTTTIPIGDWLGRLPMTGRPPRRGGGVEGAKFKPRTTSKPSYDGIRIPATFQRRKNNVQRNKGNEPKIKATLATRNDGWESPKDQDIPHSPRYFGVNIQPSGAVVPQNNEDELRLSPKNYVVVREEGLSTLYGEGISTEHLIIIVVGIIGCILLVASMFLVKYCYCDKKRRREREEKRRKENETEKSAHSDDREMSLPGMSRTSSMHSFHSMQSSRGVEPQDCHFSHSMSQHPSRVEPGDRISHNRSRSRHQALVAKHEALYRNHRAVMSQPRHHHHSIKRHPSQHRPPVHNRPLPPLPKQEEVKKQVEVDEDYCSGSDEDPDVTTMRRELSPWEIEQQKNKYRNKRA